MHDSYSIYTVLLFEFACRGGRIGVQPVAAGSGPSGYGTVAVGATITYPPALCVWNGPVRPRRDDPVCRENGYILVKTINLAKDTTTYT